MTIVLFLMMNYRNIEKGRNIVTATSFIMSILTVLFLTVARIPVAIPLNHHQAERNSRTCAEILLRYIESGVDLSQNVRKYRPNMQ